MAKRIALFAESGTSVEALPHGNTYPTGAITIPESTIEAGDLVLFYKNDVQDDFDPYGKADIYKNGIFFKTILYAPELGALGPDMVGQDELKEQGW